MFHFAVPFTHALRYDFVPGCAYDPGLIEEVVLYLLLPNIIHRTPERMQTRTMMRLR